MYINEGSRIYIKEVKNVDDNEIVELFWQRSESALTATEQKYRNYCYAIALNILQNNEDAEECVNETLSRAWNAIPPARPVILRTYLGKITRNLSINIFQKQNALKRGLGQNNLAFSEIEDFFLGYEKNIDSFIEEEFITQVLNNFLEQLEVTQRKIFVRRYWYASRIEAIASDYNISVNKVKSILFRLKKKLKTELEKEGIL